MNNPRITAKERGLIKGAIRRVFSRSDLRRSVVQSTLIHNYLDPKRPRVSKWSLCTSCSSYTPTYLMEVDHKRPVIPVYDTLEDMTWDELVDNIWCDSEYLQAICKTCHLKKTKEESILRKKYKREKKENEQSSKSIKRASPKRNQRITRK